MTERADLHLHTTASDGAWSPAELVETAKRLNLRAIAVTDHDTVAGVLESVERGRQAGIEVIPGVELSVEHGGDEVHLLGYYIDCNDAHFLATLAKCRNARTERIHRMVERLNEAGCDITADQVLRAVTGSPGRPHVARVLVAEGYAASIPDAFDRWLSEGRPGYVPRTRLSLAEGVALIHAAGGVAVLAHPGLLKDESLIGSAIEVGIDGIEVVHSEHSAAQQARYDALASEHGLLRTGGSDSHGPGVKRALYIGEFTIPMEWVAKLREASHRS